MKKAFTFTMLLILGFIINVNAQTYKYYSTDFAYKTKNQYGYWSDWSAWEDSRCLIIISIDRSVINIYSETPQEFDIYDTIGESNDNSGKSYTLCCVDKDGLRCHIRLRQQDNGIRQLYVEYNDITYVYCINERN